MGGRDRLVPRKRCSYRQCNLEPRPTQAAAYCDALGPDCWGFGISPGQDVKFINGARLGSAGAPLTRGNS